MLIVGFFGLFSCDRDFMCWPEHLYATIQLTNCDNNEDALGPNGAMPSLVLLHFSLVCKTINLIHINYTRG